MTFFCGTRFILWYNIRLTCLTVSLPSSALFTRSNETCNQKPKRSFRQKSISIIFRYFISFVFIYGTKLYTKLNQYRVLSESQNWPAKPWLFPRSFDKELFPSCMLFRFWLIWLDSFDQKWNSHYDRIGLASQCWQMESTLRKDFRLTCIG